jgi:alpha-beta hydrolase superfamily lysophospholipase
MLPRRLIKWLAYLGSLCVAVVATIVLVFAVQARLRLADLRAWHRIAPEEEFRAGAADAPASFDAYRELEGRLFAEVRRRVLEDPAAADTQPLGRYNPASVVANLALDTMYNRSYELVPPGEAQGAVLLVHGLSDSPYSMRGLAETFLAQGYYVLALRMPGHGTVPAGLLDVSWEDWYGAVLLAAKHAAARVGPDKPFLAGGHSTGAALVTLYSLRTLEDPTLPRPQQLYLVSAAIGISRFAVLTNVLSGLSFIPWFEKSRWMDVFPEYDPYKYNSFPVNAANQIYTLTRVVQRTLDDLAPTGQLEAMPRVHMFQSIVDSTVTANQVILGLLARLPSRGHELIVFDINRQEMLEGLIAPGPLEDLERLRSAVDLPFRLTLIGNKARDSRAMAAYTREAGARSVTVEDLPFEWPSGVFSVGHVSLPFPIDDPVYGLTAAPGAEPQFNLGALATKGESGALVVGLGTFGRLRSNPFFDVIRARAIETLATDEGVAP